jgi:hypothetical protein
MKTSSIIVCALGLLMAHTITLGQKTEVSVQKGKVIAETATQSVAVEAGRKAILAADKNISISVDDPLVDDLLQIYKWVEAEKQAQREQIDSTSIQIIKVESESRFTLAYLVEMPNSKSERSGVCHVQGVSVLEDPAYYDLQGNLLSFDLEKSSAHKGDYYVHFPKPVEPGEKFRYICVSKLNGSMWKQGPLWHLQAAWTAANCLNYFRFILPKSAIFVDSSRPVTIMNNVDGRAAVTIRNYTGPLGDGTFHIAFLWPDKDGTNLADLPPQYRGLRNEQDQDIVRAGQIGIAKILAGQKYEDQSNPLATVGTLCSAVIHKDKELLLSLMADPVIREIAAQQYDEFVESAGPTLVEAFDFLSTPSWPDQPQNGYTHTVYLSRKGSLLHEATITLEYRDGKWYWQGMNIGEPTTAATESADSKASGGVTISRAEVNLSKATYKGLEQGKFMRDWLFLGPIHIPWNGQGYFPDAEAEQRAFRADALNFMQFEPKVTVGQKDYEWAVIHSEYGVVDLTQLSKDWYVIAYVWAQVDTPQETNAVLGIGSDDGVKVWLNGRLVHENWVVRGASADSDRVPVTFKKGTNHLVLKVQNGGGPWGFACRLLEITED